MQSDYPLTVLQHFNDSTLERSSTTYLQVKMASYSVRPVETTYKLNTVHIVPFNDSIKVLKSPDTYRESAQCVIAGQCCDFPCCPPRKNKNHPQRFDWCWDLYLLAIAICIFLTFEMTNIESKTKIGRRCQVRLTINNSTHFHADFLRRSRLTKEKKPHIVCYANVLLAGGRLRIVEQIVWVLLVF